MTNSKLGNYILDGYAYKESDVPETTTKVAKKIVFGTSSKLHWNWLASRGVGAGSDCAGFGPGAVSDGYAGFYFDYFGSDGISYAGDFSLRAVVPLRSEIPAGV